MSRIIVKGLPARTKEERLKNKFSEVGTVTDCSLKYTKEGVFRKFAFVGFATEEDAQKAVQRFHNSFIDTSRVQVELAKNFGDASKPRAWSKYSRDSSAYQQMMKTLEEKKKKKEEEDKVSKTESKSMTKHKNREAMMSELLGELKNNSDFEEFVEVHKNKAVKPTWTNDTQVSAKEVKDQSSDEKMIFDDSDEGMGESEGDDGSKSDKEGDEDVNMQTEEVESSAKKEMSDLEYLRSKISKEKGVFDSSDSDSSEQDSEDEDSKRKKVEQKRKKSNTADSGKGEEESESSSEEDEAEEEEESETKMKKTKEMETGTMVTHVVKMRGLPPHIREQEVKKFFTPIEVVRVKIAKNAKGKNTNGMATAEFKSEKDTDQAMRKNKNFIGPKRILLYKVKKDVQERVAGKPRPWEDTERGADPDDGEEETIAESGRLYVRNLAFLCKEEDLEAHFGKYGPLTEASIPIDRLTRKAKGFAFITYMIPEHAVKAFSDLDGTVFQGRMLHILPGKAKKDEATETTDNMSYKKKKELKDKAVASSSHNWNTLFLGANAVADVMAEKYGTSKSDILDPASKQSLGVRMALGETQIVAETRDFLIKNGVALDAFSQPGAARSKTVILVKNLPAGTTAGELRNLFGRYGMLNRVVMPPSGITGIVEYAEPTEARAGFRSLAYTKFQHVPLFLEWAPVDVYTTPAPSVKQAVTTEEKDKKEGTETTVKEEEKEEQDEKKTEKVAGVEEDSSESEDEVEPESTIYVKNLNFETTETKLTEMFAKCGPLRNVTVARKKDMKNPGRLLSMGYGFVEFRKRDAAQKALKTLQHSQLENHQLELKISNRVTTKPGAARKKQDPTKKQKSTKILVRNIPFEAKTKEIKELFSTFGEIKTVRLPKKLGGTGSHRGFGFVDFLTRQDAKRAFNALCHSTRLYGRRLVLEWADAEDSVDQLRKKTADHFHDEGPAKRLRKSDLMNELKLGAD